MKIGVYFCNCGTNISDKIDSGAIKGKALKSRGDIHFATIDFACSEAGKEFMEKDLKENHIDRVVVLACSPRDHEVTFMRVVSESGINPYLMQMVNIREQVAWVTKDSMKATEKAGRYLNAAIQRLIQHEPLESREIDICPDVLIIGAGPAGLKTALGIAESGRKAVIVEKTPVIGGMPVRYEELFPNMECGPCMLEPMMGDVLHGEHSENIELLTMSEVVEVIGSYGNFMVKIRQRPRYADVHKCIGCAECIGPCPVSAKNIFNCNLSERKAISFPFAGALPNAPFVDDSICLRSKGEDCHLCKDACPVEEAIMFDDKENIIQKNVGAVVIAVGSDIYDCKNIPALGYGKLPDIYTSIEFERMIASNGPTEGSIIMSEGNAPESIAILHCVGSLDKDHKEYCSGVCCSYAFKFNYTIEKKLPGSKIYHLYKEMVAPGKDEFALYQDAKHNPNASFIRYGNIKDLEIIDRNGRKIIKNKSAAADSGEFEVDMVVLCPAVVPAESSVKIGSILELARDRAGFFEELHGRLDSAQSKIKGIYLAGTCQSPMDIQKAMNQGMAVAGYILSGLVSGRKLEIKPITAAIDSDKCSGCRVCVSVCPYKAISFDAEKDVSVINEVLCQGCGTCVSACPSGAATAKHFTDGEILSEIEGVLA